MLLVKMWPLEIPITVFFQNLGTWLLSIMQGFSFLGNEMFFLIIMTGLYWCIDASLGIRVGIALLSTTSLNSWLKMSIRGSRPYWFSEKVIGYANESSFGMPSGHAQIATVVWGRIAAWLKKAWVWVICILLIILIGLSRIYLGVHFSSDVVVGWLVGIAFLLIFVFLEKPISRGWLKQKFSTQVILAFLISLVLIGIDILLVYLTSLASLDPQWTSTAKANLLKSGIDLGSSFDLKTAIVTESYTGAYSNAGIVFGMLVGISMLKKLGGFKVAANAFNKFLSYLVGLAGVLVCYLGLKMIMPDTTSYFSMTMRYLRYFLIGLWVSVVAPLLFIRFGWATKELPAPVSTGKPIKVKGGRK
jgi:membrane-associated phospholipid phosphatase